MKSELANDYACTTGNSERSIVLLGRNLSDLDPLQITELQRMVIRQRPGTQVVITDDARQMQDLVENVIVAAGIIPHELLLRMPKLEWFQQWSSGSDWLRRYPEAARASFALTNVAGIHGQQIGEHVFGMLLSLARQLPNALLAQHRKQWYRPETRDLFELADKKMVILGLGAVGRRLAELARAFGMSTVGINRTLTKQFPCVDAVVPLSTFSDVLPEADVLVVCLPLNAETEGLIGRRELGLLKPNAVLVNVGRGEIVQQPALLDALDQGRLGAALLDVFPDEPLPPASPLWEHSNVIITAHYAGLSPQNDCRAMRIFLDNMSRFLSQQPLTHVVPKMLA